MRNYWTPERDEELKRHEAAGLSAGEIAALLHTTRSAVIGRSNRLRGNQGNDRRTIQATTPWCRAAATTLERTPGEMIATSH
jgi:hypothetical protein